MGAFFFAIFYGLTWLVAQIPSRVLYVLSDLGFVLVYHLAGYRRGVVWTNLKNSFPNKTDKELKEIEVRFYRHFCDLFFETIILLHASRKKALETCTFHNLDLFEKFYEQGKSVVMTTGHYCNWELYALMGSITKNIPVGIYKPLTNHRFEKLMNNARKRFGGDPVPMRDTLRAVIDYKKKGLPILLGLVSDQTPAKNDIRYWTTFLNQDTAVFLGVEKIAQKFDMPIIFCSMSKIKRGKYEVYFEVLSEKPNEHEPYELTKMHVKALEHLIVKKPEFWLWSHRRWKRKRPQDESTSQE